MSAKRSDWAHLEGAPFSETVDMLMMQDAAISKLQRERDEARKTALEAAEEAAVEALVQVRANELKAINKGAKEYTLAFRHAILVDDVASAIHALRSARRALLKHGAPATMPDNSSSREKK